MVTIKNKERRRQERFRLEVPSKIEVIDAGLEKETRNLMTSNISAGGAFFHTAQPLLEGTEVKVDIILPLDKLILLKDEYKHAQIKLTGKVLRTESTGMAIGFDQNYIIQPWKAGPNDRDHKLRSTV